MDNSPSSPTMLKLEDVRLAQILLHQLDERGRELHSTILDNVTTLATTCRHISAMLEIAEQESEEVWSIISELTSIYNKKCDEGIELMIEFNIVKILWIDGTRQITRLWLKTVAQMIGSTTQFQSGGPVQNPSDA